MGACCGKPAAYEDATAAPVSPEDVAIDAEVTVSPTRARKSAADWEREAEEKRRAAAARELAREEARVAKEHGQVPCEGEVNRFDVRLQHRHERGQRSAGEEPHSLPPLAARATRHALPRSERRGAADEQTASEWYYS